MKILLIAFLSLFIVVTSANAQVGDGLKMDKEAKAKMKQRQNEDIDKALKEAGISDDIASKYRETTKEFGAKSNDVRKNTLLSDDEKGKQLKAISEERNAKLKELMGEDKYKAFNKIRKGQKDAEATMKGN